MRDDLRHAVRSLWAAPGFSLVALLILVLSIGASTAIYSVIDAVMLRGLPYDESDRLMAVGEQNIKFASPAARHLVAPQNYLDWRAQQDVFTGLAAINDVTISLNARGRRIPRSFARRW
jgi:putative ABC transport system permease protein